MFHSSRFRLAASILSCTPSSSDSHGRDVVRRRVPDALQVVLEALGLLVPGEVEVAEGQLALHGRPDSVGLLLRSLDRHVGRVGEDLEAVRRQPHRLAPHDGTEQVPRRVPDRAQRPCLAPGGLGDVDLVQPDRGQRAAHGVHEVVLVGALAHDERDLQELPLLPPALDEQDRRDRDHLEHRYAEHGGGRIADRDHAEPGADASLFVELGVDRRRRDQRRGEQDSGHEGQVGERLDVEVVLDDAARLQGCPAEDGNGEADHQDQPCRGNEADHRQHAALPAGHLTEVDRRRPTERERRRLAQRLPGEDQDDGQKWHDRSSSKRCAAGCAANVSRG